MTEPLTPADCDLRGLPYMALDTVRLLDSDFFALATAEEFRCAMVLWCKAWQQVPAGSLPDDDRILAHLSGARDRWCDMRDMSLHGFVKCSDGRIYHPVVCEKAIEAWPSRKDFQEKKSGAAERKEKERQDRRDLFAALKAIGITPEFNTKTADLRKLAVTNNVTKSHSDELVTGHTPVTAKREKGERRDISIPLSNDNGASADLPPDPDKQFWDNAKAYLGKSKASMIGKWCRDYGQDNAAQAITAAQLARAVDPVPFIERTLRNVRAGTEELPIV